MIWDRLQPYNPQELGPAVFGLCLAFFGGTYLTTLTAIEAYRLCGWDQAQEHLVELYKDYVDVKAANEHDNLVDEDNDGIADVKQITPEELLVRKINLLLTSCNPVRVTGAISGLWTGFMAVIATLRVKFAQTVTLGVAIAKIFIQIADKVLTPILYHLVSPEYRKWVPVIVNYGCKILAVSIAWFIQRVISAFYSAIRGAKMFANGSFSYCVRHGIVSSSLIGSDGCQIVDESSVLFNLVVAVIAVSGFWWQLSLGFTLPFPLNIIFFPLMIVEYIITWLISVEV